MKLVKTEKIETNRYKLFVEVGAEEFEAAVQKTYLKSRNKIALPGFRKGKAPRKMIEKYYGEGVFYEEAINDLYPQAYGQAIEEAKLEPVDRASIDMSEVDKNGFSFTAIVTVKPEVSVKDYKGIHAVKYIQSVSDEEVEEELERRRKQLGRLVTVEGRAAQTGDTANIDFEGFQDGVAFDGGKGQGFPLQLGSGHFIPGFEEQVVGKNVGEEFEVNVTFPEAYGEQSLAGKPAVFKCKLNELKAMELPDLDDELAKDMSDFTTLSELRDDIRKKLQERKDKEAQDIVENVLIDEVIAKMEAEVPECMFESRIDQSVKEFEYRLRSQGLNLESYLQYTNMELESFRKTFAEQAEKQVKIRLALEKVVELEGIKVSDEEVEAEYAKLAETYDMGIDDVKKALNAKDIASDISVNKAIDLVRDTAVITEEAAPAEQGEAPAKKAPAKKKAAAADAPAKKAPAKKKAAEKAEE